MIYYSFYAVDWENAFRMQLLEKKLLDMIPVHVVS